MSGPAAVRTSAAATKQLFYELARHEEREAAVAYATHLRQRLGQARAKGDDWAVKSWAEKLRQGRLGYDAGLGGRMFPVSHV